MKKRKKVMIAVLVLLIAAVAAVSGFTMLTKEEEKESMAEGEKIAEESKETEEVIKEEEKLSLQEIRNRIYESCRREEGEERISMLDMSAEDTYRTLKKYGFTLPEDLEADEEWIELIKTNVDWFIEYEGGLPIVSATPLEKILMRVRDVVLAYEGIEDPWLDLDGEENYGNYWED